jgi:hypothetical protein
MLTISTHKGNINQNHTTSVGEDVGKKEPFYTAWECKLLQPLGKKFGAFLKI